MKGMLYTPDNIKAIAELRKTVTRRLGGLGEINKESDEWMIVGTDGTYWGFEMFAPDPEDYHINIKPRYQIGEVVYIKESWANEKQYDQLKPREIPHTAKVFYLLDGYDSISMGKKRSPLFMPAWAARYFREITGVRPERLQGITPEDCLSEGIYLIRSNDFRATGYSWSDNGERFRDAVSAYAWLWDTINPKYPWSLNPWVWVYSFKQNPGRGNR